MGELSDRCQCFAVRLDGLQSYRCPECIGEGYCTQCGKCRYHCKHADARIIEAED